MARRSRQRRRRELPNGLHIDTSGDRIDLTLAPGPDEVPTTARMLCEVGYADFGDVCPLCTDRLPLMPSGRRGSAEDVPPHAVGGRVRTRTCSECNTRGSLAEADLVRWWAKEYPARFETPGLPGARAAGGVLLRGTAKGSWALLVSGRAAEGAREVLTTAGTTGEVTCVFTLPTGAWTVALLKAAYLAACLHLREIPTTADGEYAREVIRSGTFGIDGPTVSVGKDAVPFRVFRQYAVPAADAHRLWIGVALFPWSGGSVPIFGIGLGAVAFVTWPLPDCRDKALALARTNSP